MQLVAHLSCEAIWPLKQDCIKVLHKSSVAHVCLLSALLGPVCSHVRGHFLRVCVCVCVCRDIKQARDRTQDRLLQYVSLNYSISQNCNAHWIWAFRNTCTTGPFVWHGGLWGRDKGLCTGLGCNACVCLLGLCILQPGWRRCWAPGSEGLGRQRGKPP